MQYRRSNIPGGIYFFTVVTHQRAPWLREAWAVNALGDVMRLVRAQRPFETLAMVVMPDHLHCIWRLPGDDADFSTRWMLIKQGVVHRLRGRMGVQTFGKRVFGSTTCVTSGMWRSTCITSISTQSNMGLCRRSVIGRTALFTGM